MRMRISRGGQLTIPAPVRHRWGTPRVDVEDRGDELVVRPLPDPWVAVRGAFRGLVPPGENPEDWFREDREADAEIEARKARQHGYEP